MKTIGASLQTHLAGEVSTLAFCWKITRVDTTVLGFTEHHADLIVSGVTYLSVTGFTPSAVETKSGLNVDNLNVVGFLASVGMTKADVYAGKYDGASLEVFLVNYADLTMGTVKLRKGFLGEVQFGRQRFEAEVRGLMERFTRELCELYTPGCRADLGDTRCTVNLATFTVTGTLTAVTSKRVFRDTSRTEIDDYFRGGLLTWTGGLNSGLHMEVKSFVLATGEFELMLPMAYTVQVGDTYSVYKGCDKSKEMCIADFDNIINFRGEPYVPQTMTAAISAIR